MLRPVRSAAASGARLRAHWSALPTPERLCLGVIFTCDQEREQAEHTRWNRFERRLPAATWRWLAYAPRTVLAHRLAARGLNEAAFLTAATALAARGLLLQRLVEGELEATLELRLTPLGRRLARVGAEACLEG